MPFLALGKNLNWSSKWVRELNNKSWNDICKKPTKRAEAVCKDLKKSVLQDKSKFKWKSAGSDTVEVTYKKKSVKVRRSDDPLVYLVNRRSLYMEEIKTVKQLTKEVQKLLPSDQVASHPFVNAAYAAEDENAYPAQELSHAISLMILHTKEQEICETAQKIVKACKPFDEKLMKKLKDAKNEDPETLPALINKTSHIKAALGIQTEAEKFAAQFSNLDDSKSNALKKCECKSGLCQIKEKKTDQAKAYDDCRSTLKALRDFTKSKALRSISSELLSEDIDKAITAVSQLEKKKAPATPQGFREDSYRER